MFEQYFNSAVSNSIDTFDSRIFVEYLEKHL